MLEVGEVIGKARGYLTEVVPDFAKLQPKVEEIVLSPETSIWKITFLAQSPSFTLKAESLADLLSNARTIEKVVDVRADDGSLVAVRNPFSN
jgi:hypothetical protein